MSGHIQIQYLTNRQIDKAKWDHCIEHADNGLVYAYSFYLDLMAAHWDALVLNDYEAVMPLTWNRKYGIHYLYQPFLTAQLGIFGNQVSSHTVKLFIAAIPASFRLIEINLNSRNCIGIPGRFSYSRNNFTLDLHKPYQELSDAYKENTRRNIRKAIQLHCHIRKDFSPEEVIKLAWEQMVTHGRTEADHVERFRKLYQLLHQKQMAMTYGVTQENKLLASCVFFFSHRRAYYLLVGNHPDSKRTGASHALIDAFIRENAGSDLLLDFEGSDIPGLALFYKSFGAAQEVYPALKINRLPFYLRWMKR